MPDEPTPDDVNEPVDRVELIRHCRWCGAPLPDRRPRLRYCPDKDCADWARRAQRNAPHLRRIRRCGE